MDGLFSVENPIRMDDLGGKKHPIFGNTLDLPPTQ